MPIVATCNDDARVNTEISNIKADRYYKFRYSKLIGCFFDNNSPAAGSDLRTGIKPGSTLEVLYQYTMVTF